MKMERLKIFSVMLAILVATTVSRAENEKDLIAVLKSNASAAQKCDACQKLRLVGTAKAVPAVAPLLLQEPTAHAARYALEGMPCSEALVALRNAAAKTSGSNEVGLIDSLGWRRDAGAVSLLKKKLADKDPAIASSAATALGRIGGKKAADALRSASNRNGIQSAVLDGMLRCAEQFKADGDTKRAAAIYKELDNEKSPALIRRAAAHGLVSLNPY